MSASIKFNSRLSPHEVMSRVRSMIGADAIRLSAPYSGRVKQNSFRLMRFPWFSYPFMPVVVGTINPVDTASEVSLRVVSPWVHHLFMLTVLLIWISILWPPQAETYVSAFLGGMIWFVAALSHRHTGKALMSAVQQELI